MGREGTAVDDAKARIRERQAAFERRHVRLSTPQTVQDAIDSNQ